MAADRIGRSGSSTGRRAIMLQGRCSLGVAALLACALATTARAEVQVEGSPAALRVTTSRDAVADVLAALASTLNIRYRTAVPLDAAAAPSYSGSVGQVLSRLLDGYNYVIKNDQEKTEVVIFGRRGEMAVPPPAPKPASSQGILSRWR